MHEQPQQEALYESSSPAYMQPLTGQGEFCPI